MKNSLSRSVLIVEDDPMVRRLLVRHFEKAGDTIEQAASAEDALSIFMKRDARFDVVVTDIHLSGRTGLDMANQLRAHKPRQPIVFVTGDVDEELARRALSAGKVGYLLKPFEFFELDAAVAQAVGTRSVADEPFEQMLETGRNQWLATQRRLLIAASEKPVDIGSFGPAHAAHVAAC